MDIKEFKTNIDEKREIRPQYPDEKKESINYKIYSLIGAISVALIIIIAVFIRINRFDIRDYIKPVYTGANGYASVTFIIDEQRLSSRLLGKNPDSDRQYYVQKFIESLSAHTDAVDIKNKDTLNVVIDYNVAYANELKADIPNNEYTYKAKGISEGAMLDIYSGVSVVFTGISPDAGIVVSNDWEDDYLKTLTFSASKEKGISLGDSVTVSCNNPYEELARHGIIARSMEMNYTADMLSSYCKSSADINGDVMNTIYSEIKSVIKKETEDVTYRMLFAATGNTDYLYHLNEENADNITIEAVYFLNGTSEAAAVDSKEGNIIRNYIIVEASADISDNDGSEKVYYMFVYNNAYITIDGSFNVGHDNQNRRFACSTDEEALYTEYIDDLKNSYSVDKIK